MSRSGPDNLGLCVLAIVAAISVASSAALADVDVSIDEGTCTQAFEILPLDRQSPSPARETAYHVDVERNSRPPVEFTDILSTTAIDQSPATNYCQSTDAQIPSPQTVHQLPAGPGGATLFLMGVGCLGAVKIGKSARGLHLQSLPEWFHTGGPVQIGHVSVLDLDARVLLPPHYDQSPSDNSALASFPHALPPLWSLKAQCLLTSTDTRGPPLSSH